MEVHKRASKMENVVIELPSGMMKKKDGGDEALLLELLKESRVLLMNRVAAQKRRIVELTAQYNELLAEVNGVGVETEEEDVEALKAHLADMEENAKKLTKEIEEARHVCVVRSEEMEQLSKSVLKVAKERDGVREELDKAVGEIADMTAELAKVKEELKEKKKQLVGNTGRMNSYKMMVDYAKAMGVQFPRMEVMKKAVAGMASVVEGGESTAEMFEGMRESYEEFVKEADEFVERMKGADARKEPWADAPGTVAGEEAKPKANALGTVAEKEKAADKKVAKAKMNSEDYSDAVAMDKQDCPWGVEQAKNRVAIVGGRYCRKTCPWNDGINEDENFVHCSKKK